MDPIVLRCFLWLSFADPHDERGSNDLHGANSPASGVIVTVTATSVADGTKMASATIMVTAIMVSVSPAAATVAPGSTAKFTATVTNDGENKGVAWTVSCPAASCGSVSPTSTPSGTATTYTPPSPPPVGNLTVTLTAASVTNPVASASATITILGITISISPASASVPSAGTQPFTANVTNDPTNGGVTWSLGEEFSTRTCIRFPIFHCFFSTSFNPCSPGCGTISPPSTASGTPTTYTAPAHFTPPFSFCLPFPFPCRRFLGVFIQATSVTNTGAFSRASITILPISVSVSPTSASVVVNLTLQFTATVTNDGANGGAGAGVTWTLTQNGVACSPGCGTVSPTNTASGASTTYTAPAVVPDLPLVTITATAVTDVTKSASAVITVTTASGAACGAGSGSESLLKGQYAFRVQGFLPGGFAPLIGSFTADGTGKITEGEQDAGSSGPQPFDITKSFYWVGPDHRGCLTLGGTTYYRFALGSINASNIATAGHIIEFDDTTGTSSGVPAVRNAGTLKLQDATSFAADQFKDNYVIGLAGGGTGGTRSAVAGTFTSDGISAITASNLDFDGAGIVTSNVASTPGGSFTCCDADGRGTLQLTGSSFALNFVMYMVNSSDIFLDSTDDIFSGEAIGISSGTTFSQASLSGSSVIRKTAQSTSGPLVDVALASANGTGAITVTDNVNSAGTFTTTANALNYLVAANGRVTFTGVTTPPVIYLFGSNKGFLVGTDANVEFGILEPQSAGPFSNASLSGAYTFGTENPSAITVTMQSGVVTPDGKGNASGTSDQSSSSGLAQNQSVSLTYSVAADGTGNFGANTTAILISGNKLVFISNTDTDPTITVVEK